METDDFSRELSFTLYGRCARAQPHTLLEGAGTQQDAAGKENRI